MRTCRSGPADDDAGHLQQLLLDGFTTRKEVAQLHTNLVFEQRRKPTVPPTREVLTS